MLYKGAQLADILSLHQGSSIFNYVHSLYCTSLLSSQGKIYMLIFVTTEQADVSGQRDGFENLTIKEIEVAKPKAGEVLVKVHAVSLNVCPSILLLHNIY